MRGIMVVFEGLDLVGKTTIAKKVAEKDGWAYFRTPPPGYIERCKEFDINGCTVYSKERFMFFLDCLKYSSQKIAELLKVGISVAVDRWLWTTLSYHFAFNTELETTWLGKGIFDIMRPDMSILVYISNENEYRKRVMERPLLTNSDMVIVGDKQKRKEIMDRFKSLNPDFVPIDNSTDLELSMNTVWRQIAQTSASQKSILVQPIIPMAGKTENDENR